MNSTLTIYTATYTLHDHISTDKLVEETRLLCGVNPENIERHDLPNITNFTVSLFIDEEQNDPKAYFQEIANDFERWLGVDVTLGEVILDN